MTPCMHLYVLASGSKGNAAVVEGPHGSVLIDCGLSRKRLHERADEVGCNLANVVAVLLTHEHGDHTGGLTVLFNHFGGPVYTTAGTASGRRHLANLPFTLVDHDQTLEVAGMRVRAFPTSHDVCDPMCFRFEVPSPDDPLHPRDAIGWVTDTGFVTDEAIEALYGCRILGIEANHDPRMLASGPYPAFLKARVAGDTGHLSNDQAAQVLPDLVTSDTETIVALHLSQENNRPSLAVRALAAAVGAEPANTTFTEARTPDGLLTVCASAQDRPLVVW
ncbi:MAG: MBL fold metallo-hydrolase [Coriobacteriales bacterium]|nr:MBL fold metallo-hydrolase [Coriobacteriales bacterium]